MDDLTRAWFGRRTSRWQDWPADRLLAAKRRLGVTISVVIPARNEERTVAGVVGAIFRSLVTEVPLVDELVVIDSDSADATAAAAARAGAVVHRAAEVMPSAGSFPGKGEALWKSLHVTSGDLLVFIDADLTRWGPHFVSGLLGPLLADEEVRLVKGFYTRVRTETDGSTSAEGGRVTELVARPLISLWWPELAGVVQPLAGEWAARRSLMESLSIPVGYGVELATLMDTVSGYGIDAVAQVDLGSRAHRHQANHDLALMAAELLLVAERRRPAGQREPSDAAAGLQQFVRGEDGTGPPGFPARPGERAAAGVLGTRPARRERTAWRQPMGDGQGGGGEDGPREQGVLRLGRHASPPGQPLIMGIVNRTPDSFFRPGADLGRVGRAGAGRTRSSPRAPTSSTLAGSRPRPARRSTSARRSGGRPGSSARSGPAIPDIVISVDTWRHETGRAACEAGADLLNDSWGGFDERLAEVAAEFGAGLVCAHAGRQQPRTRPFRVAYDDVMADVLGHTLRLARRALAAGVQPERIVIDAAHDFGKNTWHSLEITRRLNEMTRDRLAGPGVAVQQGLRRRDPEPAARAAAARHPGGDRGQRLARRQDLPGASGHRVPPGGRHGRGHPRRPAAGPRRPGTGLAVITAAALCPAPPLLARELTGADPVLPELRQACLDAVTALLSRRP